MFEQIWEQKSRAVVLVASVVAVLAIAALDWWTKPYFSLGFLYLFPIMLAAGFLPRWAIVALAAIVTVDERGFIELANRAAIELMAPRDGHLIGYPIAAFLPELHHALRWEDRPQFRTSMQCRGHRGNGETFLADVWFSSYKDGAKPKLAAIIADVSEEQVHPAAINSVTSDQQERTQLSTRELDALRLVVQGLANKEIASRMEISESAVKNTLQQLFAKTEVRTRGQLVRVALERYRDLL